MKLYLSVLTGLSVCAGIAFAAGWGKSREPDSITRDPLDVVTRLTAAMNERKIDAALALFADPVQFQLVSDKPAADHRMVRSWLESQAAAQGRTEISDLWLAGDTVTWVIREYHGSAVTFSMRCAQIRGGQIQSMKSVRLISSGDDGGLSPKVEDAKVSCNPVGVAWSSESP